MEVRYLSVLIMDNWEVLFKWKSLGFIWDNIEDKHLLSEDDQMRIEDDS